uniref:Probable RNA polymerase II nuclear localization protein SLC7A6OS n=1 Tax=Haemonchus contortus TaxID=6289 RepID=A0A7I4YNW2_HAECO
MADIMPIIRVRRKRSADPHAALIMETKKRKEDPLLFSLFKTETASDIMDGITGARVIEFKAGCSNEAEGKGLEFIGEHSDGSAGPSDDSMGDNNIDENEAVRYDYYKIYRGSMTEPIKQWNSDIELRFATEEEQTLLLGNSDSESDCAADDDDDSNDENNWRNDYPEEEDDDDDDTEDEDLNYYDEDDRMVRRNVYDEHDESPFALERMRRRLEGFEMGVYEGEEDDSDDDYIRGDYSRKSTPDYGDYDIRYRED